MASAVANLHNREVNDARFNKEAANWESRPGVHKASGQACETILAHLNHEALERPLGQMQVLEIGCGTGIVYPKLSFLLAPHVKRVVAADPAHGMIDVLKEKLTKPDAPKNIIPLAILLEDSEDPALPPADSSRPAGPRQKFDLITSHLVLHHIPDLNSVLETMYECLAPGGRVALTDFQDFGPAARRFHAKSRMDGVCRDGINAGWMEEVMQQVGFMNVEVEPQFTMEKKVEKFEGEFGDDASAWDTEGMGEMMEFPFLLCSGVKSKRA